ncbi:hypothetical protein BC629DRAFT_37657 [Irpex lacteus]|nr:hypothetical protein BC629DRAFT_37657 [Irpex lacteus]
MLAFARPKRTPRPCVHFQRSASEPSRRQLLHTAVAIFAAHFLTDSRLSPGSLRSLANIRVPELSRNAGMTRRNLLNIGSISLPERSSCDGCTRVRCFHNMSGISGFLPKPSRPCGSDVASSAKATAGYVSAIHHIRFLELTNINCVAVMFMRVPI